MMKLYSVRDKVMERCAPPFAAPNDAAAVRLFKNLQFPQGTPVSDFELVSCGNFNEAGFFPVLFDGDPEVQKALDECAKEPREVMGNTDG